MLDEDEKKLEKASGFVGKADHEVNDDPGVAHQHDSVSSSCECAHLTMMVGINRRGIRSKSTLESSQTGGLFA